MPLVDVSLTVETAALPADVRDFLREADQRIEQFCQDAHIPGFIPSDHTTAYRVLQALSRQGIAPGALFCEWGSGFGVIACLAAMVGFDACGIEIEGELVDAARQLAADFGLSVEFHRGSFIPAGNEARFDGPGFTRLKTDANSAQQEWGLVPADFDAVFAYPWPDEEHVIAALFERYATAGAVLLTYHGEQHLSVRRKTNGRPRDRRGGRRGGL
jgi:protein-L-isoaspartate O-methyltransferase